MYTHTHTSFDYWFWKVEAGKFPTIGTVKREYYANTTCHIIGWSYLMMLLSLMFSTRFRFFLCALSSMERSGWIPSLSCCHGKGFNPLPFNLSILHLASLSSHLLLTFFRQHAETRANMAFWISLWGRKWGNFSMNLLLALLSTAAVAIIRESLLSLG